MKFGYNSNFRILLGNSNFLFKNIINSCEYLRFNTISSPSYYFTTYSKDQTPSTNSFKIPHWLDIPGSDSNFLSDTLSNNSQESKNLFDNGYESRKLTDKVVVSSEEKELKIINKPRPLKKIRPFRLNELSAFNTSPYKLIKPIKKNPVLSHIWKLRVNSTYRKGLEKRLVVGSSLIRHILTHTEARFDTILTTDKDLIDFVLSNPTFNSRYSRIQLVDRYTLQYCLRGTTHSNIAPDAVSDAVIPKPNTHITPKFVVAIDNLKYSRNIGSIIRTCLAFGVDLLYYINGTTDPFNWKVSSITGGLQYSIPHRFGDLSDLRKFCKKNELIPVVAHLEGEPLETFKLSGKGVCLILGNESQGPNPQSFNFAHRLSLYMHPFTDSLNVSIAGAIIIRQLKCLQLTQ